MPDTVIRGLQPVRTNRVHDAPVENHPRLRHASLESRAYRQRDFCLDARGWDYRDCLACGDGSIVRDSIVPVTGDLRAGSDEIASASSSSFIGVSRSSITLAGHDVGPRAALAACLRALSLQCFGVGGFAAN